MIMATTPFTFPDEEELFFQKQKALCVTMATTPFPFPEEEELCVHKKGSV